jgi:hypothetical protein
LLYVPDPESNYKRKQHHFLSLRRRGKEKQTRKKLRKEAEIDKKHESHFTNLQEQQKLMTAAI